MSEVAPNSWFRSAGASLAILSCINLLNYLDRYLVPPLFETLKADLRLSDTQLGLLLPGFLVVYTLTAPLFGALGDTKSRPRLIAFGVGFWSLATALTGFAGSFFTLIATRASVGVGEAAYGTIAPSLLADYYPAARRGRVMAIFFCAIPVGSALGYIVGGVMNAHFGWRSAFFVAAVPGLLLALLCLGLRDPPRGSQDAVPAPATETPPDGVGHPSTAVGLGANTKATYIGLLRNRPYVFTVLGYAAYTFAIGGLATWMPSFLQRVRAVPAETATTQFGAIVVVTGFIGTFVGGWLGDYCLKYSHRAYLIVSAAATLLAVPFVWFALTADAKITYNACLVGAELLMFLSTGPINACIVNLVPANERASAVALSVFTIHFLGDVLSPTLIGVLSDHSSLQQALKIVPVAVIVAAALWAWAVREQRRQ